MNEISIVCDNFNLHGQRSVLNVSSNFLEELTNRMSVPRSVVAADKDIGKVINELHELLQEVPKERVSQQLVRMCVAVACGLFDSGVNYIWNETIVALHERIRVYGLSVVAKILDKEFGEKQLNGMSDNELLDCCLKLNLLTEEGHFYLNCNREMRNKCSVAHPAICDIDKTEVIVFITRCIKYVLSEKDTPRGVDFGRLISSIKSGRFSSEQKRAWLDRLTKTHDAQRQLIVGNLYGIYCDPDADEQSRLNAFDLCEGMKNIITNEAKLDILNKHSNFVAKGDGQRCKASMKFFERIQWISLLDSCDKNILYSHAVDDLYIVHNNFNNFYNEPPFAERLSNIVKQGAVPETVLEKYVVTVMCCFVGNGWGVSDKAFRYYEEMIQGFSPREVSVMLKLSESSQNLLGRRISDCRNCRQNFVEALKMLDKNTVPSSVMSIYNKYIK